jgi:hypothetical protein
MSWAPLLFVPPNPISVPDGCSSRAAASSKVQRRYAARVVAARASEAAIFRKIAEGKLSPIDNQARDHTAMSLASGAGNARRNVARFHSRKLRLPDA